MTPEQGNQLAQTLIYVAKVAQQTQILSDRMTALFYNTATNQWGPQQGEQNGLHAMLKLIAQEAGVDAAELAQIEAAAKRGAAAAAEEQRASFIAELIAALPEDKDGNLTVADVEAGVQRVFARAGGTTPAA